MQSSTVWKCGICFSEEFSDSNPLVRECTWGSNDECHRVHRECLAIWMRTHPGKTGCFYSSEGTLIEENAFSRWELNCRKATQFANRLSPILKKIEVIAKGILAFSVVMLYVFGARTAGVLNVEIN